MIGRYGFYRQERDQTPTHLSEDPLVALDAGIVRAHTFRKTPVLLVVDTTTIGVDARRSRRIGFPDDILADIIPMTAIVAAYEIDPARRTDLYFSDEPAEDIRLLFRPVELASKET